MKEKIVENINILGKFCGKRDLSALVPSQLKSKYGLEQVDVMVLFGGSILAGGDVMAEAMKNKIAKKYIIVGCLGHTTEALRENDFYFNQNILGMWNIERYITLLMGEIPRLLDDINGYGPRGMNFIAHVDIPSVVMNAFIELNKDYSSLIRDANPLYSS